MIPWVEGLHFLKLGAGSRNGKSGICRPILCLLAHNYQVVEVHRLVAGPDSDVFLL